jgi:DMSO reductase anchor subunit
VLSILATRCATKNGRHTVVLVNAHLSWCLLLFLVGISHSRFHLISPVRPINSLIQATQFFYFVDAQHSTHQCEMEHSFSSCTVAKTTLSRQNVTCLLYCCKIIQAVMQLVQSRVSQFSTRIFTVAAILP